MFHNQSDSIKHMSFSSLDMLRKSNPSWRLLSAKNAAFISAFLYQEFILRNIRQIAEDELIENLEDYIAQITASMKESHYNRSGKDYLNEWTDDEHCWLRKFYPPGQDQPHFDITAQAQTAIEWLTNLKPQSFIGTESRLMTVFELFRQIISGAEANPEQRLQSLTRQKEAIEAEIKRVEKGEISVLSDTQIKERFWQAMTTARDILFDFRAVEQNFRDLDRKIRAQIAVWDKGKGELLETIFSEENGIAESDQGKSFQAFWSFLMSSTSQDDFSTMLDKVLQLKPVLELNSGSDSKKIQNEWVDAGKHIQKTIALLSQQLRHYVDENYIEEERRIGRILREVEKMAISVRNDAPDNWTLTLNGMKPDISLPLDRPLYTPLMPTGIKQDMIGIGSGDFSTDLLYSQIYIDREKLEDNIYQFLQQQEHITLTEVIEKYPLDHGVSEIIMYLVIAGDSTNASFYEDILEELIWHESDGTTRMAKIPQITFTRLKDKDGTHDK